MNKIRVRTIVRLLAKSEIITKVLAFILKHIVVDIGYSI